MAMSAADGTAGVACVRRGRRGGRPVCGGAAVAALGRVDVLVNNAGVFPFGPTAQTSEADFDSVYRINVQVPYFLVARLAPAMAERGHGAIVNVSTMVAEFGMSGMGLYGSSKAALELLTK